MSQWSRAPVVLTTDNPYSSRTDVPKKASLRCLRFGQAARPGACRYASSAVQYLQRSGGRGSR